MARTFEGAIAGGAVEAGANGAGQGAAAGGRGAADPAGAAEWGPGRAGGGFPGFTLRDWEGGVADPGGVSAAEEGFPGVKPIGERAYPTGGGHNPVLGRRASPEWLCRGGAFRLRVCHSVFAFAHAEEWRPSQRHTPGGRRAAPRGGRAPLVPRWYCSRPHRRPAAGRAPAPPRARLGGSPPGVGPAAGRGGGQKQ